MTSAHRVGRIGGLVLGIALCGTSAQAQTGVGTGLPSGFTAPGLPFGPTATVPTVASPTPVMAIANPGGLSFGGASSGTGIGLGALSASPGTGAGSLSTAGGGGGTVAGGIGQTGRLPNDDVTGSIGTSGGGGAPAGAGIAGGAGFRRTPTDAYYDPLGGSGFR